ncbi:MAG: PilZ domain-containing protein [Candidatus Omnitrophota bacterium]
MTWEGLNRRKFPRVKFPCLVKILVNGEKNEAQLTHTENVSTGGICVILRKGLERLTQVDIEIDLLDGEDHIFCHGKAVWVVRRKATDLFKPSFYDIGIEYGDIKKEDVQRIKAAVDHLARNESKAKI